MRKKLYLIRHGETVFNLEDRKQGQCDSPLTKKGINQMMVDRKWFIDNNIVFDHVYCSTLPRAIKCTELITDHPFEIDDRIKERSFGKDEGMKQNGKHSDDVYPGDVGGESNIQLKNRVIPVYKEIMNKDDHQCVMIMSHGGICWQLSEAYKEYGDIDPLPRSVSNGAIYIYEYENEIFYLKKIIEN